MTGDAPARHTPRMRQGEQQDSRLRVAAIAAFAALLALGITNPLLGSGVGSSPVLTQDQSTYVDWGDSLFVFSMAASGLLILWFRPRHSVGWLLLLIGGIEGACTLGQVYGARAFVFPEEGLPGGLWALQLSAPLWLAAVFLPVTCLLLRYPSGAVQGRWARRVDRGVVAGLIAVYVGYATSAESVTDVLKGHQPPVTLPGAVRGALFVLGALLVLTGTAFTVVHTGIRTWRATYPERQQLLWLITLVPLAVLLIFSPWEQTQKLFLGIPLAVVVGVLRYRLAGIEVVVRRTLLYGSLTGLVLLVFVAVTAAVSALVPSGGLPQVVAAAVVAVAVVPLRDRLQRLVDKVVYGDRGDPLSALRRLVTPMGLAGGESLLPDVLGGLARSLRVPGAEIVGRGGTRAALGMPGEHAYEVPLVMGGQGIGVLRLAPRAGEAQLPPADQRLAESLAPLVAAVLRSVELAEALQLEQSRVVAATETERARLRQELHDGLGPSLTGIGLGLEALESKVGASDLVTRLRAETTSSLEEVRRIIDGLRPGALEDADLLSLLRLRAEHLSATTPVRVTVTAPARMAPLPPDVEDAALRIVEEALTNVVRHAGATTCTVAVSLDDALRLIVRDDGRGFDGPRDGGVGVGSMQDRASRLGGALRIEGSETGTVVTAALPVVAVPEQVVVG